MTESGFNCRFSDLYSTYMNPSPMKFSRFFMTALLASSLAGCQPQGESTTDSTDNPTQEMPKIEVSYPVTAKGDVVEDYHGTEVADPYRWLEVEDSAEVKDWVVAQNKATFGYLDQIPFRGAIRNRMEELWNYPKYSAPFKRGENYFYYKNDGLQNQYVLYKMDNLDAEAKPFLDPNTFSEDGTASLTNFTVSSDGKYAAYGISEGGSDWNEFHIRNVETGEDLEDHLKWLKFSGASWHGDGFYYGRFAEPKEGKELSSQNENKQIFFHKVGTDQSEDKLIYEEPEHPRRGIYAGTTDDERFLMFYLSEGATNNTALTVRDLSQAEAPQKQIITGFDYSYSLIDNIGSEMLFLTTDGASRKRVVSIDFENPGKENWKEIVPEKEEVLNSVSLVGGKLFAVYLKDASSKVYIYDLEGNQEGEVELPGIGTVSGFRGKKDETTAFYVFTSFTYPPSIFKYDVATNKSELFRKSEVDFDVDNYETKQVFYESKDGTKVPMFITHKKGLKMDGNNPTLLYGYGGFNINILPSFSVTNLALLENNGIYAVANLRGGGEYGEDWHVGGMLHQKQNVFDDFIGAAEYLIAEKYTSSEKLGIYGRSNGGLLVGAAMTQRPDLFKVAIPGVGVLDMLRYHKFTIGHAWAVEYGSSDEAEHFPNLYGYSPLHNLKKGTAYPATMITTADHDDRVVPAHSFKFAAQLQATHEGDNPVLIRIETMAGHGAGKPTSMVIDEYADMWSFLFYNTNSPVNY